MRLYFNSGSGHLDFGLGILECGFGTNPNSKIKKPHTYRQVFFSMNPLRIVFMGTPEFAVPMLQQLIKRQENIIAVVTQPDRPVGRGRQVKACPVKQLAAESMLTVLQPEKIKTPEFVAAFRKLEPDLAVVAAYGQIFSQDLLDIPAHGFINVHSSLLPAYRGPAPINWAIINGDTETGVTIMKVSLRMDEGDILLQEKIPILPEDDAQTLHDRIAGVGARLLGTSIDMLKKGQWQPMPQDHSRATYAPMLKKQDGCIDWSRDSRTILNRIRGMTPWPGCYTFCGGRLLKIHRAESLERNTDASPGTVTSAGAEGIIVAAGTGALLLKEIQLEGKKRMQAEEFLRGHKVTAGMKFTDK